MLISTGITVIVLIVLKYIINFASYYYLVNKYDNLGKDYIISAPSFFTLLLSVKTIDIKDHISTEHVNYKVGQGLSYEKAYLYEECIAWEMIWLQYSKCYRSIYFKQGKDPIALKDHIVNLQMEYQLLEITDTLENIFKGEDND